MGIIFIIFWGFLKQIQVLAWEVLQTSGDLVIFKPLAWPYLGHMFLEKCLGKSKRVTSESLPWGHATSVLLCVFKAIHWIFGLYLVAQWAFDPNSKKMFHGVSGPPAAL